MIRQLVERSCSWLGVGILLHAHALGAAQQTTPIPHDKLSEKDRLDAELQHVNPTLEGWSTEVLSSLAQNQLAELGKAGLKEEHVAGSALPKWVTDDVQFTDLRPQELEVLHKSEQLRIARGTIGAEVHTGRDALAESFAALHACLADDHHPHVKFKVVRVEMPDEGHFITQGLFRAWSDGDAGTAQSDATWICTWLRVGDELRLTTLRVEAYSESSAAKPFFAECSAAVLGDTQAWKEQFSRGTNEWCAEIERGAGMDQYGHSGLTVGDFDGDGLEDVYVCQAGGLPNRLFLQQPDGSAQDHTAEFGLDWIDNTKSALLADLDGDGKQELVLTTNAGLLVLSRKNSQRFEVAVNLPAAGGYGLAAADYDADGLIDIYVCSYATSEKRSGLPSPYHDANNGPPNMLFRNLGKLRFEDVTAKVGLDENNRRFSFAASWADYDNDGDPDLYVSNDFGRNSLYRNDAGKFKDVAGAAGVEDISAGMGVSWGDYDGDGLFDIYISNMFSSAGQRIAYQRRFKANEDATAKQLLQRHARGNSLFRNLGDGTFSDVTIAAGVWMGRWAWGAEFVDFDNDGREDIFVPNGFVSNEDTKDL